MQYNIFLKYFNLLLNDVKKVGELFRFRTSLLNTMFLYRNSPIRYRLEITPSGPHAKITVYFCIGGVISCDLYDSFQECPCSQSRPY
jgi:hypothetical protein